MGLEFRGGLRNSLLQSFYFIEEAAGAWKEDCPGSAGPVVPKFSWHQNHRDGLLNTDCQVPPPESLFRWVWGGAREFLTSPHMVLMLLVWEHILRISDLSQWLSQMRLLLSSLCTFPINGGSQRLYNSEKLREVGQPARASLSAGMECILLPI